MASPCPPSPTLNERGCDKEGFELGFISSGSSTIVPSGPSASVSSGFSAMVSSGFSVVGNPRPTQLGELKLRECCGSNLEQSVRSVIWSEILNEII